MASPASPPPLTERLAALLTDHMARTGEAAADTARRLGVAEEVVRRWIAQAGGDPDAAEFAHLDTAAKLGAWLRARIADTGRTVRDLADATESVSTSTVYNWLKGDHLPPPPVGDEPDRFDLFLSHPALDLDLRQRVRLDEVRRRLTGTSLRPVADPGADWPARALPAGNRTFTGRTEERRRLDRLLARHARGDTAVVAALTGMGGTGKTALAVHWARTREVRATFTDGCLYLDLNGYAETPPLSVDTALRKLLQQFGADPASLPADTDALAARYQETVAGRRLLLVLDNAHAEPQVRPLLPAGPGCLTLVTSRNRLQGLDVTGGPVTHVPLDVLTARESGSLLRKLIGALIAKSTADADIDALADACGHLPLALQIAAANYLTRARPEQVSLREYAAALTDRRMDALAVGPTDPALAVTAVLDASYRHLSAGARRTYRLLGLHPGPDWTTAAAASLTARDRDATAALLAELAEANLVSEHEGRWSFHDLVRDHAALTARRADADGVRAEAVARLLDHYLHSAFAADRALAPARDPIVLAPAAEGTAPERPGTSQEAVAWFGAEQRVLHHLCARADADGHDARTWDLAWSLSNLLDHSGAWTEMAAVWRSGLAAARRLGDDAGTAIALRTLAYAHLQLEQHDTAQRHLEQALAVFERLGDHTGLAHTYIMLSHVSESQRLPETSLDLLRHALEHYRAAGSLDGEARALSGIGWTLVLLGRYEEAIPDCERALALHLQCGNQSGSAGPLDSLGYLHHRLGHYDAAVDYLGRALAVHREHANLRPQATVLVHLGEAHEAAGRPGAARDAWTRALQIYDDLDHPEAGRVRARLTALPQDGAAGPAPGLPSE
ncbi:hypothetical protein GCM10009853_032830 [Glycomyces scopariae]